MREDGYILSLVRSKQRQRSYQIHCSNRCSNRVYKHSEPSPRLCNKGSRGCAPHCSAPQPLTPTTRQALRHYCHDPAPPSIDLHKYSTSLIHAAILGFRKDINTKPDLTFLPFSLSSTTSLDKHPRKPKQPNQTPWTS